MKKWARVGMTIEVEEVLWKENQELAVLDAFKNGKAMLDGETYFPEQADENDGTENDLDLLSGTIKLVEEIKRVHNVSLKNAIEERQKLLDLAKSIEDWHTEQFFSESSKMPKNERLKAAINRTVKEIYDEYHQINNEIEKVTKDLEVKMEVK